MTPEQQQAIKNEINTAIDTGAAITVAVAPEFAGFIVLGRAVAKALPDLYFDVVNAMNKAAPTQADRDALNAKIDALLNPESE